LQTDLTYRHLTEKIRSNRSLPAAAHDLLRIIKNPFLDENDPRHTRDILRGKALAWILCGGPNVTIEEAQQRAVAMGYAGLMAFIKG
jgi:hypothetical protein